MRQGAFRAPPEIKADGNLQLDVLRKVNQSGDPSAFDEPANKAAEARTHAFDLANCGWASADVTVKDYFYSGVPGSAKPGPLSIQLANKGKESHEFSLFRINDGVNESVKDIVALPEAEAMKKVTMVGATFAEPGGRTTRCSSLTRKIWSGVLHSPGREARRPAPCQQGHVRQAPPPSGVSSHQNPGDLLRRVRHARVSVASCSRNPSDHQTGGGPISAIRSSRTSGRLTPSRSVNATSTTRSRPGRRP